MCTLIQEYIYAKQELSFFPGISVPVYGFVVCSVFKEMAHKRRHCYCNILRASNVNISGVFIGSEHQWHLSNRWSPYTYGKSLHWTVLTLEWWGVVLFLIAESCFPYIFWTRLPKSFSLLTSFTIAIAALKPAAEMFLKPDFCFK